jgi:hypothetical protein
MEAKIISIKAFDGLNAYVSPNLAKSGEFSRIENATCDRAGTISTAKGSTRIGDDKSIHFDYGLFRFPNEKTTSVTGFVGATDNCGLYRVADTDTGTSTIYYLSGDMDEWIPLVGHGAGVAWQSTPPICTAVAEGDLYLVGGQQENRYILGSDGSTVMPWDYGNLIGAPKANKVAYFGGRIYLADYELEIDGNTEYFHSHVRFSSPLLGVAARVEGDFATGSTTINVTDIKYIYETDSIEVYRGSTLVTTLTVTGKSSTEGTYSITVSATDADIKSFDELWIPGTRSLDSKRVFRWAESGIGNDETKRYDDVELPGVIGSNAVNTLCTVGDYLAIAAKDSFAWWDSYRLIGSGMGVGVCSPNGFISAFGSGYGLDYTGIYQWTPGTVVPKLMSTPVDPYITGATKAGLDSAMSARIGFHLYWYVGDVTLYRDDGSVEKVVADVTLDYDIRMDNWYVHVGKRANFMCMWSEGIRANALAIVADHTAVNHNHVFEAFYGDKEDSGGDAESEVFFRADTVPQLIGLSPETVGYPSAVVVECDRGSGGQVFARLDEGDWYQLKGEFKKGISVIPITSPIPSEITPPSCSRISLSFRHSNVGGCRLSAVSIVVYQSPEDVMANQSNQ